MNITLNLKTEQTKTTEYRNTKSLWKKIGKKCRLTYISIEQNNDYAQLKHKVQFCSSFKIFENLWTIIKLHGDFFEFHVLWSSKGTQYTTCFMQVSSLLAKWIRVKRICGYNFNRIIKSTWLYTTRSSNSQIGMLWNW